jgi:hypothetical protein
MFEAGGTAAGAEAAFSAGGCCWLEQPARIALAETARAARPRSRRLTNVVLSTLGGAGAQVPQPVVWQLPQPLAVLLMTLNEFSIALLLSRQIGE